MLHRIREGARSVVTARALWLAAVFAVGCAEFQRRDTPVALPASAVGRRVTVASGRRVYVEARGQGPETPVLLVHGFASNRETWSTVEPALRAARRTIAVDLPGFGYSDRTAGDYAPEAPADHPPSLLERPPRHPVDVGPHSRGCPV